MSPKLLLVKCITLLYRESLLSERTENSADLVRTVLEGIKLPEHSLSLNPDRELLMALRDTTLYLCTNASDNICDRDELLQRLKVDCTYDEKLYEAFVQGIEKDMDEGSLKRTILSIRKFINDSFRENEIVKLIKEANTQLTFRRESIKNVRTFVSELCTKLEPYQIESNRKDPSIVASVDIGDTSGLTEAFDKVKAIDDHTGLLVTGWQGFNIMIQGGFRRGDQVVLAALQHKYKTGFTLALFKQLAIYNKPIMINVNKKPLLLRISFEDDLSINLKYLYQNIYFNEHSSLPKIKDVPTIEMATYIKEKMEINGYQIKMMRVNPSNWTYKDLQNYILELEANGYEIHVCMVDYLALLPTTGCEDGPMGHALRDLFRRTRGFFSARGITFITPHQLSTDAKQLLRDGHQDFVKNLPGKGYFAGSKQLDQDPDLIVYMHIESLNKKSYLTLQRDKHRGGDIISDDDKYFVLPFPEKGPIPDDLGRQRIDCSKVGGGAKGSGNEIPFWENTQ